MNAEAPKRVDLVWMLIGAFEDPGRTDTSEVNRAITCANKRVVPIHFVSENQTLEAVAIKNN